MEADFEKLPGVLEAVSGYTGGQVPNPSYEQVSSGRTGHAEAVRLRYDPGQIRYEELLAHFWRNIDPTVKDRQFCDVGSQYRAEIFYLDEDQRRLAEASREALSQRFPQVHTRISAAGPFYDAEPAHQDYARRNPLRYRFYRNGCGRDARLEALWGPR